MKTTELTEELRGADAYSVKKILKKALESEIPVSELGMITLAMAELLEAQETEISGIQRTLEHHNLY